MVKPNKHIKTRWPEVSSWSQPKQITWHKISGQNNDGSTIERAKKTKEARVHVIELCKSAFNC